MSLRATVLAAMLCVTSSGAAQTAAQHVAAGDKETAERNLPAALQHYQEAVAADSNDVDALWKASHAAVDLGEFLVAGGDVLRGGLGGTGAGDAQHCGEHRGA